MSFYVALVVGMAAGVPIGLVLGERWRF